MRQRGTLPWDPGVTYVAPNLLVEKRLGLRPKQLEKVVTVIQECAVVGAEVGVV